MTLARDIVRRGFREDNLIPIGREPTAAEFVEGLELLNGFLLSAYGFELGEPMEDWVAPQPQRTAPVAANYPQLPYPTGADIGLNPVPLASDNTYNIYPFPPPNSRIVWSGDPLTIYMPEGPRPGSRIALVQGSGARTNPAPGTLLVLDGNSRLIETTPGVTAPTMTLTHPLEPIQWFYRSDTGVWRIVRPLGLDDDLYFAPEYDDAWICALSIRLAPRYAKQVADATKTNAQRMLSKVQIDHRQVAPTVYKSYDIPRGLESFASGQWSW